MTEYDRCFQDALREGPVALSARGTARRAELREMLTTAVVRRRRRRHTVRATALAAVLIAAVAVLWSPDVSVQPAPGGPVVARGPAYVHVQIVQNDPDIVQRFATRTRPLPADLWLDDDGLIQRLAEIGRPAGLLRTADRVIVAGDVVDEIGE